MNRKYRKTIIAGNWKMHKTATETKRFAERLKGALPRSKRCSIVLCVPYVDIPAAVKLLKDSRVAVGAQNLHWEASGPFTGEISAAMLADLDVKYVIIGHSERPRGVRRCRCSLDPQNSVHSSSSGGGNSAAWKTRSVRNARC